MRKQFRSLLLLSALSGFLLAGVFAGVDAAQQPAKAARWSDPATWPRNTNIREFKGNVAHSNYDAFMMDRNVAANALWVKVVSPDSGPLGLGGGTTLQVSR